MIVGGNDESRRLSYFLSNNHNKTYIRGGASRMTNEDILRWLERIADVLHENAAYLTQLDSAIGDADHGNNMDRGFKAVRDKFPTIATMDIATQLKTVGTTL